LTEREASIQIQNLDSFLHSACDFERHYVSPLAKERVATISPDLLWACLASL
jgi:hypothetical protein